MKLTVYTPTTKFSYEDVSRLLLDTESGQIEILPGHQRLISALAIGTAKLVFDHKSETLVVNSGVIKVDNDDLEIITSQATPGSEIIEKDIEKAILLAEKKITPTTLPTELIRIEKEIKYQKLKQKLRDQFGHE